MFSTILSNLIKFIKNSYTECANEIQAAVLLTGVNMPDHIAQFAALRKEIRKVVTPHVVRLQSENCQNLKSFVENVVHGFVNVKQMVIMLSFNHFVIIANIDACNVS